MINEHQFSSDVTFISILAGVLSCDILNCVNNLKGLIRYY